MLRIPPPLGGTYSLRINKNYVYTFVSVMKLHTQN